VLSSKEMVRGGSSFCRGTGRPSTGGEVSEEKGGLLPYLQDFFSYVKGPEEGSLVSVQGVGQKEDSNGKKYLLLRKKIEGKRGISGCS